MFCDCEIGFWFLFLQLPLIEACTRFYRLLFICNHCSALNSVPKTISNDCSFFLFVWLSVAATVCVCMCLTDCQNFESVASWGKQCRKFSGNTWTGWELYACLFIFHGKTCHWKCCSSLFVSCNRWILQSWNKCCFVAAYPLRLYTWTPSVSGYDELSFYLLTYIFSETT